MDPGSFIQAWDSGQQEFQIMSSGSTGPSKPILLQRKWMIWSAKNSGKVIHFTDDDRLLCCLPMDKVGGMMVVVRSKVWGLPLEIREPSANPLNKDTQSTIVSLTPYQLSHILEDAASKSRLSHFKEVLIGGSAIDVQLENKIRALKSPSIFRHSYGMSETYSHIAIRTLNGPESTQGFKCLEGVRVEQNEDQCAVIYAPFCEEGLVTNDIVAFQNDGSFKVIGRRDFVINTGSVKIPAEALEDLISAELNPSGRFLVSSIQDKILGEKLVLVSENAEEFTGQDWQFVKAVYPFGAPRQILKMAPIPFNAGGKPDRLKVREMINKGN